MNERVAVREEEILEYLIHAFSIPVNSVWMFLVIRYVDLKKDDLFRSHQWHYLEFQGFVRMQMEENPFGIS